MPVVPDVPPEHVGVDVAVDDSRRRPARRRSRGRTSRTCPGCRRRSWPRPGARSLPGTVLPRSRVTRSQLKTLSRRLMTTRSIPAPQSIESIAAVVLARVDDVVARAGVDDVRAPARPEAVGARPPVERVVAAAAPEAVVAGLAQEDVVALLAVDVVGGGEADEDVLAVAPEDAVARVRSLEDVRAVRPDDALGLGGGREHQGQDQRRTRAGRAKMFVSPTPSESTK